MKITHHALLRYVQRIIGIKDDAQSEIHVNENELFLKLELLKAYEKSKLIIENYSIDARVKENHDYYLYDNILLMIKIKEGKPVLKTVYKFNFDDDYDISHFYSKIKEINKNINEKNRIEKERREHIEKIIMLESTINEIEKFKETVKGRLFELGNTSLEYKKKIAKLKTETKMMIEGVIHNYFER